MTEISPFAPFANATLTFQIADGTSTINSVGNYQTNTVPLIITAVLKPSINSSEVQTYAQEIDQFVGADASAALFDGYLVDPLVYPSGLKFLSEADASIIVSGGFTQEGRFKLLPVVQSPFVVAIGIQIITPIRGIFRRN